MSAPRIHIPAGTAVGYQKTMVARCPHALDLEAGNHYLLARNGRGKTTLLRTLARSLRPLSGSPQVSGTAQFIGEDLGFDPELSAKSVFSCLLSRPARDKAMALADILELDMKKPYGHLSRGNRQKVAVLLAEFRITEQASVIFLDEPLSGLDDHARNTILNHWQRNTTNILRLITCHPDFDAMDLGVPVVIADGLIRKAREDEGRDWGRIKQILN